MIIALYGIKYDSSHQFFFSKDYTQNWKGIMCILIMITHILEKYNWPNTLYNIHSFGYIEVAIFFMFSGYGLKYNYNSNPEYIKHFFSKRFVKIYIPYLLCSLVTYVIQIVILQTKNLEIIQLIKIAFGVDAIWFVKALLIFYLAFGLIYRFSKQKANIIMAVFTLCYIAVCCIFDRDKCWYGSVIPFFMGICMADNIDKIRLKPVNKIYIALFTVLSAVFEVAYQIFKDDKILGSLITRNLLCIAIVILFILVTRHFKTGNKVSEFMGKISYEFFLLHFASIAIVRKSAGGLAIDIQVIIIYLLAVLMAYIMNKVDKEVLKRVVH